MRRGQEAVESAVTRSGDVHETCTRSWHDRARRYALRRRVGIATAANAAPSVKGLVADKLRDNLFVIRGSDPKAFVGGNTAVFIQANGVTLVDSKVPGWGQPLIEKVKELTDKPITTLINTHTHFDHTGGNPDFPATVEVVTHENTARYMKENNPVSGLTIDVPDVFKNSGGRGLPKRTFKDRLTLGSGNDRVELHYFGRAHTGGDAFIVFPVARALHTGDAFPNKGVPIMDANNGGSGVDYADTIAKAAALSEHRHRHHRPCQHDVDDGRREGVCRLQPGVRRTRACGQEGRPDGGTGDQLESAGAVSEERLHPTDAGRASVERAGGVERDQIGRTHPDV